MGLERIRVRQDQRLSGFDGGAEGRGRIWVGEIDIYRIVLDLHGLSGKMEDVPAAW